MRCNNCMFWQKYNITKKMYIKDHKGEMPGECRKELPRFEPNYQNGRWPETTENQWCGHWQKDPEVMGKQIQSIENLPIEKLKLREAAYNALIKASQRGGDFRYVGQLIEASDKRLMGIRGFGAGCLVNVRSRIEHLRLYVASIGKDSKP